MTDALEGRLDAVWVFGHDLTKVIDEKRLRELSQKLKLFVFSGTNESGTASLLGPAHGRVGRERRDVREQEGAGCRGSVSRFLRFRTPGRRDRLKVYLGHAGWSPGQLQGEIARGSWTLVPADAFTLFQKSPEAIWPELSQSGVTVAGSTGCGVRANVVELTNF